MCDALFVWAAQELRVSDFILCADDPIWLQIDGKWQTCTDISLTRSETANLVNRFAQQDQAAGKVQTGVSLDFAYSIKCGRGMFYRFRVNVTHSNKGHYIVMRALPTELPKLDGLGLENGIVENLYPSCGLVVVSGVMGSGKSTLLAGVLHTAILTKGRQILTLEEPIEFDFSTIPHSQRSAPITQSGIGVDVESWEAGVRTMTRRKGEIVMVGESRDRETLDAMLSTVEQGVTAYTTVHAQDVPQTITRIVNAFPEEERPTKASVLKANLRLIVHQRLVPRERTNEEIAGGKVSGRIPLREFLPFDEAIRRRLYQVSYADLVPEIRNMVSLYGQSLLQDAERKFQQKLIGEDTYLSVRHEQEVGALAAA
jgi:Tfp pilus assembly pilus retraction ATPase PilT